MRVYFILGTAAELIKMYPILLGLSKSQTDAYVWNTGQSSTNFWTQYDDFGFSRQKSFCLDPAAADLRARSSALKWFLRNLISSKKFLRAEIAKHTGHEPLPGELAFVHGDTLSTLLGSILAKRLGLKIVHVEAGMRSGKWYEPFPEEINRRLVSRMANYHFAPDENAAANLRREGHKGHIEISKGNSVYDAVRFGLECPRPEGLPSGKYVVCNLHRFENLHSKERWQSLVDTTLEAAQSYPVHFVMHPPTRARLEGDPVSRQKLLKAGVHMLDRMSYMRYLHLVAKAHYLITDSGSNQQECSYIGTPCLLLREHTESVEGLGQNCVLSKLDPAVIKSFLENPEQYRRSPQLLNESPSGQILKSLQLQAPQSLSSV